jgi:hypothetical protein
MNREFELAKVLATIAGFIIIASSIFFSTAVTIESNIFNPPSSIEKEKLGQYMTTIENLWRLEYRTGWLFLSVGLIFGFVSLRFAYLGYKIASKSTPRPSLKSRSRKARRT